MHVAKQIIPSAFTGHSMGFMLEEMVEVSSWFFSNFGIRISDRLRDHSFFILTFSRRKYLGLTSLSNLTYSKNSFDLLSSKFKCLPANENP